MERLQSHLAEVVADEIRHLLASIYKLSTLSHEWQLALAPSIESMYDELDRLTEQQPPRR